MQIKVMVVMMLALVQIVTVSSLFSPYGYGIIKQAALHNNIHNLAEGWRQYGDRLLYRDYVQEKFKFLGTRTPSLHYPSWGISNNTITYILALDKYNSGGYASVVGGGVGQRYVTLSFRSKLSHGIKFLVEIYGK